MRTRTIYRACNMASNRWHAGYYEAAERQFRTFEAELLRRMDGVDALRAELSETRAYLRHAAMRIDGFIVTTNNLRDDVIRLTAERDMCANEFGTLNRIVVDAQGEITDLEAV